MKVVGSISTLDELLTLLSKDAWQYILIRFYLVITFVRVISCCVFRGRRFFVFPTLPSHN
jgi:hypothetical protein